ncbi:MAG TPA: hypothetical protein VN207_00340, partial [Ktedonobacteraceae bacterium]|nr:hypothetical protein [Ktedonobacteraceae bacterium]
MQESKSGTTQAQTIIIIAITLFALSGFVVGFAFGTFTRPQGETTQSAIQNHDIPVVSQKTSSTPPPTPQPQVPSLGCPDVEANVSQMVADGKIAYEATIQAKDKTGNQGDKCPDIAQEKPVVADGITCKIWLTKAQDSSGDLSNDSSQLQHVDQLNNPSPNEIPSGLIFDPNTPQVQPCKQGQGHWKFTISPTVSPGDYFIVGLTDLQGIHYNWSWY